MAQYSAYNWEDNVCFLKGKKQLEIIQNEEYNEMWVIKYPDGEISGMFNKTRAKDNAVKYLCSTPEKQAPLASTEPVGEFKSKKGTRVAPPSKTP